MTTKPIWQSKTVWLNVISAILTVLEQQQITGIFPVGAAPYFALVVFMLNIALRYLTTLPVTLTR